MELNLPSVIAIIVSAASAIWVFYTTKIIPARQQAEADRLRYQRDTERDDREHLQESNTKALAQVLSLFEMMTKHLIQSDNGKSQETLRLLQENNKLLSTIQANTSWSKFEEVLTDVDMQLQEIKVGVKQTDSTVVEVKERLKELEYGNGTTD